MSSYLNLALAFLPKQIEKCEDEQDDDEIELGCLHQAIDSNMEQEHTRPNKDISMAILVDSYGSIMVGGMRTHIGSCS